MKAYQQNTGAFSFVEIIITVAVVGLLATIGVLGIGNVVDSSRSQKLQTDTVTINSAVQSYIGSGGSVDDVESVDDLLFRLKTKTDISMAQRMPGLSSSLIDPRVTTVMQSASEAETTDARVFWDPAARRLQILNGGVAGVKEFRLDETLAEVEATTVERATAMKYAGQSTWIWDYQDVALPSASKGPDSFSVSPDVVLSPPPVTTPPVNPVAKFTLAPPIPSLPGGSYPASGFDLAVSLSNPNQLGVSEIFYALNYGNWIRYAAPLTIAPGTVLSAQAIPIVDDWESSGKVDGTYTAVTFNLLAPRVIPDASSFGTAVGEVVTVTLTDTNATGLAKLQYRVNGGAWSPYSGAFPLLASSFPSGATIEAQAISANLDDYLPSPISTGRVEPGSLSFSGSVSGVFNSPVGPVDMVTNLPPGGSSDTFRWGDANGSGYKQSDMVFTGGSFPSIAAGMRFKIGTLNYFNGTIRSGTGADKIDLDIYLNLLAGGKTYTPYFDFCFALINSPNTGTDPWAAADYVRLTDPRASRTIVIEGNEYEFRVEFGETTADGFADFDEFFVLEDKDATVNVYGTFVRLGTARENTDALNGGTSISTAPGTGGIGDVTY